MFLPNDKISIHKIIFFYYYVCMKSSELVKQLRHFDQQHDYWLYSLHELALIFPDEEPQQLKNSLVRQCKAGNLLKVGGGLYAWPDARSAPMYRLEHLINRLRPRELSYISLESALSMHGWLSQIPLAVLTVMTTGRSYLQQTAYGLIEWTHTEQSDTTILNGTTWDPMRGCLIAKPLLAGRDMRQVGRNLDLVIPQSDVEM
ncbi:type IV toxin-antitoxin system AbiEi family antitoxin [Aeromonas caviae]|uniref:type IV toxin-antitoxin system AbiEi family antitoxin n=1 Tax=Aeromonas caviae TaxID=648 RepID=UPI0038730138